MRLVRENVRTEFGRKYGFNKIRNIDDFRSLLPLTTYENYTEYIERLANGERNILTAYLTEHISIWDGFKGLPQSRWSAQTCYDYGFCAGFYVVGHHGFLSEGMTLNLVDDSIEQLSSGVTVGNLLGRLLMKRDFDTKQVYAIPVDVINSSKEDKKLYLQALHALAQQNVLSLARPC